MAAPPIANLYLAVVPTVSGIQGNLTKQLVPQLAGAGSKAGNVAGDEINKSIGSKVKGNLGKIMKTAMIGAVAGVAGLAVAGKAFYNLGASFTEMKNTIRVGTGATGKALDDLSSSARDVAKTVPTSFEDAGAVVGDLNTLLGLTGKPLENMSAQFINLARITGTDVKTNIEAASRAFGDWGVETKDQPAFMDKLFRASQATGVGVDALAQQVVQFGAPMRGMGFSIDETAALLGSFEKAGVNTELVMGSMRQALGKFAKEGKKAPEALRELMEQIKAAPDDTAAASMAMEVFGARAGADMADTIRGGKFEIDELMSSIANGSDTINAAAADTMTFAEKWQIFKNRALDAVEPVATAVFNLAGVLLDRALPAIDEIAGGITAFGAAWKANDGDITSSGLPGFMERLAFVLRRTFDFVNGTVIPAIQRFGKFLNDNKVIILSVIGVVGSMVAGFFAVSGTVAAVTGAVGLATGAFAAVKSALVTARIAMMLFNGALLANPIGLIIAAIAGLVAGFVLAYRNIGWFKDGVNSAFGTIKNVVGSVVTWFSGTAMPWVSNAIRKVGGVFTWLYQNIVRPIWTAIRVVIAVVVGVVLTYIDMWVAIFKNVLAPVFTWLYRNIVKPVFAGIKSVINAVSQWVMHTLVPFVRSAITTLGSVFRWLKDKIVEPVWSGIKWIIGNAWAGIKIYFNAIKWVIDNVLAPVFRFLKDRVVKPVWDGIKSIISSSWNFIRDRVFTPLKDGIQNGVVGAFEKARDGIKRAWDKIQGVVKKPVAFVLETVLQNGLIKNINNVLKNVGVKKRIPDVWPVAGFRQGGYTGNYAKDEVAGVVHGRENVINAESSAAIERSAPGFLSSLNKKGAAALNMLNPANMAPGAGVYGGKASFSGGNQQAIFRSGVMNVAGTAPGWGLVQAMSMLDRATSIKVKRGPGTGMNGVTVRANNYPAWWAGYYQGDDGSIMLNNRTMGGASAIAKRTVLAHELGHALGLPHSDPGGGQSIMSYENMYKHNSVTDADVKALSAIYGGSGKGSSGGGIFDWISEKLNPVKKFLDGMTSMLSSGLGTGLLADMVSGAVKMITGGITDWVTDKIKGSDDGKDHGASLIPTLYDGGGLLKTGTQLIEHGKRHPDAVFTRQQTLDYQTLAEYARRNQASERFTNNGTVIAKEGIREVADEFYKKQAQKEALRSSL